MSDSVNYNSALFHIRACGVPMRGKTFSDSKRKLRDPSKSAEKVAGYKS